MHGTWVGAVTEGIRRFGLPFFIALFIELIGSALIMQPPAWLKYLDQPVLDAFTRWQLTDRAPDDIVIVDIDEESLQQIAPWPWPRDVMAKLLRAIERMQPSGIGLDMVFPESRDPEADRILAHVVQESTVPICIAQAFDLFGRARRHIGLLAGGHPVSPMFKAVSASGYVGNYPQLAQAAHCVGHITPWLDHDGLVRQVPRWIQLDHQAWPFLSAALLAQRPEGDARLVPVPYRIRPENWTAVSAWRVLLDSLNPDLIKGRWVLIGSSALGLGDKVTTPVHPWLPGVVIHAELLDGLLRPLPKMPLSEKLATWIGLTLLVLSVTTLIILRRFYSALGVMMILMGLWLASAFVLWQARVYFPVTVPVWAGGIMLLTLLPWAWWQLYRQQKHIRQLFEGFVSPEVVSQLLRAPETTLAPQKKEVTVLFADISGFTQLSKQVSTEDLAQITQEVLTILTEQVHRYQGTVDKYIGDAVMAFWNAPMAQPDHACRAMRCALAMQQALAQWNARHPERAPVRIHIAVHTGEVMVGDLGTRYRHTYTAIGDTVNVAARLLERASHVAGQLVLSSRSLKAAQRQCADFVMKAEPQMTVLDE